MNFYIDRQFGVAIFIDVQNGIVQKIYNEREKFINKMNELYLGKTISFLKVDFEERMKPIYHSVRSADIVNGLRKVDAIGSRIRSINVQLSNYETADDLKVELEKKRDEYQLELGEAHQELEQTKARIKSEHNYNFKI